MAYRYDNFSTTYQPCFRSGNHDVSGQASRYLRGLMQSPKRNMERMAETVPDTDYQALQHFLTHAHWDHQAVMEKVSHDANAWLGPSRMPRAIWAWGIIKPANGNPGIGIWPW